MEQEEARRKLEEGGVMLCMGVPQGTELHCDMAGLVVGPKFRGIKMLPPGLHLFCWDAGQVRPITVTMESAPLALASRTADYPLGN